MSNFKKSKIMPKIYEYLGILISFYSNEHNPIHVHARFQDAVVKVTFFINNGRIYRTSYKNERGNFPVAKMKALKKFISVYKFHIIYRWELYFIWKKSPNFEKITKKL